jgi:hypothetical protein
MKKLALVLAIVFAGFMSANAQVWVGGGVGARAEKGLTTFEIAPEIGYMIPNTSLTLALGADYAFAKAGGISTNALVLEPYIRYVGGTIGHKFSLFVDLTGDFGLLDAKGAYGVFLRPGIAWQATEKFTAAFRFGYLGFDHGFESDPIFQSGNGFVMKCDLAAPSIRLYYTL